MNASYLFSPGNYLVHHGYQRIPPNHHRHYLSFSWMISWALRWPVWSFRFSFSLIFNLTLFNPRKSEDIDKWLMNLHTGYLVEGVFKFHFGTTDAQPQGSILHIRLFYSQNRGVCLTLVYRRGLVTTLLRIIFRPAKTLNFTIKWVQLIIRSSFPVILAQKILLPYPGVGVG